MWRLIRITVLLTVLGFVALGALADRRRTTEWQSPLWIGVFPVNGDGRVATDDYIAALTREQFTSVEDFFGREAHAHGIALEQPVHIELYPPVTELPPRLAPGTGVLGRVWWSLRIRYYTWRLAGDTPADVRLFVLYHDPAVTEAVPHSLGLQQGLLGVVYAYAAADADATNDVVIAHEVMHTLGATDKYDPATNLPAFPEGYGDPRAWPRYPQRTAEIMAGRLAISAQSAEVPTDLDEVVVGRQTAAEINWAPP